MPMEALGAQWSPFRGQMKLRCVWSTHHVLGGLGRGTGTGTLSAPITAVLPSPHPNRWCLESPEAMRPGSPSFWWEGCPGCRDGVPEGGKEIPLNGCHLRYSQPVLALLGLPSVLEHPREEETLVGMQCGSHSRSMVATPSPGTATQLSSLAHTTMS